MSKKKTETTKSKDVKEVKGEPNKETVQITAATVFNKAIVRKGKILTVTPQEATRLYRMKKARPYQEKNQTEPVAKESD